MYWLCPHEKMETCMKQELLTDIKHNTSFHVYLPLRGKQSLYLDDPANVIFTLYTLLTKVKCFCSCSCRHYWLHIHRTVSKMVLPQPSWLLPQCTRQDQDGRDSDIAIHEALRICCHEYLQDVIDATICLQYFLFLLYNTYSWPWTEQGCHPVCHHYRLHTRWFQCFPPSDLIHKKEQ